MNAFLKDKLETIEKFTELIIEHNSSTAPAHKRAIIVNEMSSGILEIVEKIRDGDKNGD